MTHRSRTDTTKPPIAERAGCPPLDLFEAAAKREMSKKQALPEDEPFYEHLKGCPACVREFQDMKEHLLSERYIKLSTRLCYLVILIIVLREIVHHYHFFG